MTDCTIDWSAIFIANKDVTTTHRHLMSMLLLLLLHVIASADTRRTWESQLTCKYDNNFDRDKRDRVAAL